MTLAKNDWERGPVVVLKAARWNKRSLNGMLAHLPEKPVFCRDFSKALDLAKKKKATLLAWASRFSNENQATCEQEGIPLVFMEDGFVRSVGLGAAFVPAASLIFDSRGIYYDPSRPSDLEWMLEHQHVTLEQRQTGAQIRQLLLAEAVTKYNLRGDPSSMPTLPKDRKIILVPGQVSDDASILKTKSRSLDLSSDLNPNLLLLERVRTDHPDAIIVFKPHPDVQSGLRLGSVSPDQAACYADIVATNADILDLINGCDHVETISSLTGFEALLRGKTVTTHGQPFYNGWGLTEDKTPVSRRTRVRSLDELVFLTLALYPRYINPNDYTSCDCFVAFANLAQIRGNNNKSIRFKARKFIKRIGHQLGL